MLISASSSSLQDHRCALANSFIRLFAIASIPAQIFWQHCAPLETKPNLTTSMDTWQLIGLSSQAKMRSTLPSLTSSMIYLFFLLANVLVWASYSFANDDRLPPFSRNSNIEPNLHNETNTHVNGNASQNVFTSSISCGQTEFYVQLTFTKPFKGLLYAYRNYRPDDDSLPSLHYPVQILDTCTLRGNGASVVYLELSFFSECVEKMVAYIEPQVNKSTNAPDNVELPFETNVVNSTESPIINESTISSKFNLDGFNFRRALDSSQQVNASSEQLFQLSLYIQSDATIEQKTDSKVTIQCSSQTTKNIVFEQNVSSDYSRKVETSPSKNRTIIPSGSLTVDTQQLNETLLSGPVPSGRIDILRGRVPFVKLIERSVELGDDLTAIIRAKTTPDGFAWKVSQCYAHEGNNTVTHELTNQQGCPVNNLMSAFKVLPQSGTDYSQVFYTTFAAFKFAESSHLNLQCHLLLCRQPCPPEPCETTSLV